MRDLNDGEWGWVAGHEGFSHARSEHSGTHAKDDARREHDGGTLRPWGKPNTPTPGKLGCMTSMTLLARLATQFSRCLTWPP
jgi:hypothetical protein